MELKQRQYSVLIVSSQPKFNEALLSLMGERNHYDYTLENSICTAKRRLQGRDYDIVIINAPLPDDNGVRLAIDRSKSGSCAVLLAVRNEYYPDIFRNVCPYGVYTLPKPPSRQMVSLALDWLESTHERLAGLKKKEISLEDKMTEIRLVNRAKWLLITKKGLTEEGAHHAVEKLAMDKCVTKKAIAERIIAAEGDIRL